MLSVQSQFRILKSTSFKPLNQSEIYLLTLTVVKAEIQRQELNKALVSLESLIPKLMDSSSLEKVLARALTYRFIICKLQNSNYNYHQDTFLQRQFTTDLSLLPNNTDKIFLEANQYIQNNPIYKSNNVANSLPSLFNILEPHY